MWSSSTCQGSAPLGVMWKRQPLPLLYLKLAWSAPVLGPVPPALLLGERWPRLAWGCVTPSQCSRVLCAAAFAPCPHPVPHEPILRPCSRLRAPARFFHLDSWGGPGNWELALRCQEGRASLTQQGEEETKWKVLPTRFSLVWIWGRELGCWKSETLDSPRNKKVWKQGRGTRYQKPPE